MKIDLRKPSGNRFERDLRAILVETMMGGGMSLSRIKIKGSKEQMIRFASVLAAEKEYLEAVEQQGGRFYYGHQNESKAERQN